MSDDHHDDHQDLLQFLYEMPVGVVSMSEAGAVSLMNPAANRMLAIEVVEGERVTEPLPVLRRLAPILFEKLDADPAQMGRIGAGRGEEVDGRDGSTRFAVTLHRVRAGFVTVALTDVTEERRLQEERREQSQRLQTALLGRVDPTALEVASAYLPAHREDVTGGDWFDVIDLGDDRAALVVGDVVGHEIEASATMGQLRAIIRAFAVSDPDPVGVFDRTEILAQTIEGASCATAQYAVVDRAAGTVEYLSAGHPPAVVLRAGGGVELLEHGRRPVLAAVPNPPSTSASAFVGQGDVLVMYTDGLIERRGETLDDGIRRLVDVGRSLDTSQAMERIIDALLSEMLDETNQTDDVCVLAARIPSVDS